MKPVLQPHLLTACELGRNLRRDPGSVVRVLLALAVASHLTGVAVLAAQPPTSPEHQATPAPETHATQAAEGRAGAEHEGAKHEGLGGLLWPTVNFLILVGGLYYFLRTPFTEYLNGRSSQIRKDLVEAAELSRTATAQLAEVDQKLKALPGEIEALKTRGAQEIAAEEERISSVAAGDRARLLTQTRREIEVRLQSAKRELSDHAAELAVALAKQRLSREMTPADHARLVDRYVDQVKDR